MFARYVLRLELTAGSLGWWDLNVGEKKGSRYIYSFRDVAANAEGGGASGNPFDQDLDQQNDFEQDTEEHEQKARGLKQLELLNKMDAMISSGILAQGIPPAPQANLAHRATTGFDPSATKTEDVRQPAREISAEISADPVRRLYRPRPAPLSPSNGPAQAHVCTTASRAHRPPPAPSAPPRPAPPRPPCQAFQSSKQRVLLEEKLHAMHEAHAESLAKLDKQQAALAEQMGNLVDTVNKFVAPKP
jgi:hypothetical protein